MAKAKVDVKALTKAIIATAKPGVTSKEIAAIVTQAGHKIAPTSVAALLAHHNRG